MRQQQRNFRKFNRNNRDKDGPIPFEVLFRKWKKKVERDGLMKELKKREFHVTRGEKRRQRIKDGRRRAEKLRQQELRLQAEGLLRSKRR